MPFYIVTKIKLVTIQEEQAGDLWLKDYPYLQGMYVCSPDGTVFRCLDGAKCSTIPPTNFGNSEYPYLSFLQTVKKCKVTARTPAVFKAAKDWEDLSYFDAAKGTYVGTIAVGTFAYDKGRIYECITDNEANARYYQPSASSTVKAWKLTAFSANKEAVTKRSFVKTKATLPECIADDFNASAKKGTTALFGSSQSLKSSPNLTVKSGQVCSSDTEMRRKLQAGNAKFTNIDAGAISGVTFQIEVIKNTVSPDIVELLLAGRDGFITLQDLESAMFSFPLFCADAVTGDTEEQSCAKDIAGFIFYILAKDIVDAAAKPSNVVKYWQVGLKNVYDEECYYTWYDYIQFGKTEVATGRKTPQ